MDHSDMHKGIRIAQSCESDPRAAVKEFHAQVLQPDMALVIFFFCSDEYDRVTLAAEMNRLLRRRAGCGLHDRRRDRPDGLPRPQHRRREPRFERLHRHERPSSSTCRSSRSTKAWSDRPRAASTGFDRLSTDSTGSTGSTGPTPTAPAAPTGRNSFAFVAHRRPVGARRARRARAPGRPGRDPRRRRLGRQRPELRRHLRLLRGALLRGQRRPGWW